MNHESECRVINKADTQRIDAYEESWMDVHDFVRNANIRRIPTSHHFHPSLSPVVSLSLGILHEWMRTQML